MNERGEPVSSSTLVTVLSVMAVAAALAFSMSASAQPMGQMPMNTNQMSQMMGQQMPMNRPMTRQQMDQMMTQMQRQMAQMDATVKALRAQLNKVNPDLLTGQERPMYEYLKILQTHMESMHPMTQTMQDTMRGMMQRMMQMPGSSR